jgi:hypothetical protein
LTTQPNKEKICFFFIVPKKKQEKLKLEAFSFSEEKMVKKSKTRQGQEIFLANHCPWGDTDNQEGRSD